MNERSRPNFQAAGAKGDRRTPLGQEMKAGLAVITALVVVVGLVVVKRVKDRSLTSSDQGAGAGRSFSGGAFQKVAPTERRSSDPMIVSAAPHSSEVGGVTSPAPPLLPQSAQHLAPARKNFGPHAPESFPEADSMEFPVGRSSEQFGNPSATPMERAAMTPPPTAPQPAPQREVRPATLQQPAMEQTNQRPATLRTEANDSFWHLARRAYGNAGYFKALYEYNRFRFPHPDRLPAGELVDAPPRERLHKLYPKLCPPADHVGAVAAGGPRGQAGRGPGGPVEISVNSPTPSQRKFLAPGSRTYTVREGESLADIAGAVLGRRTWWTEIYRLNRQRLGDQFQYPPTGMKLLLPESSAPVAGRPPPQDTYR